MADRSVVYEFRGRFDNLKAGLTAAGSSVQDFGKKLTALDRQGAQMRQAFGTVGSAAGRMGVAAAGGLALVSKAAIDWESAWAGVQKTVDGSASEMAKLEGELRGLAKTLPATHTEIAAVAEAAGQLGIERESIAGFTRTMIDLGETTNLSADEAATSLARFMNIMGTSQSEVSRLGSSLVGLGNNFATTESEILAMSMRLAGAGRQASLSESDVIGLSAAMSSVGIEAEAGGTAMSLTMKRIAKEVETSGDKLGLFAQVSGMTAEQFATAWQDDAAGALTSFVSGLGNAEQLGMSTNMVLSELGITGIREADSLLRLSGAAEMMGDAFRLSGEEASKNTALALEAGKRYDTTASQMQVSWNNVKDTMIDFGQSALPVIQAGADALGGLAGIAGSLPGPIKAVSTSMLGVTAVLGGGLWFTSKAISGVADMREALQTLGVSGAGASKALRGVAIAAGGLVALNAAFALVDQLNKKLDESLPGMEAFTQQLIGLGTATEGQSWLGLSSEFDSLGQSVARIADGRWDDGLSSFFDKLLPGDTRAKSLREATAEVELLDAALANLVGTGNADLAATALERLGDTQGLSASQMRDLVGLLPGYAEALKGQENAALLAGDASAAAAAGMGEMGAEAAGASAAVSSLSEALNALLGPTLNQDAATVAWKRSIQSLTEELEGGTGALDRNTKKGQDNRDAIRDRVSALTSMIAADEEAGVSADVMQRKMLRGAEAILQAGQAAGIAESDMKGYLRQLGLTPKQIKTLIQNNAPEAKNKVDDLNNSLARVPRNIQTQINVAVSGLSSAMSSLGALNPFRGMGSADGSTVPKDGGPYADRYPYLLAPGEEVISNRHGQADRWRPLLKAINAGRLADGGTVQGLAKGGTVYGGVASGRLPGNVDTRIELLSLQQSIRELQRDLNKMGKESLKGLDREIAQLTLTSKRREFQEALVTAERAKELRQLTRLRDSREELLQVERDALESLREASRSMSEQIAGAFKTDLFGGTDLTEAAIKGLLPSEFFAGLGAWTDEASLRAAIDQRVSGMSATERQRWEAQAGLGILRTDTANAKAFEDALAAAVGKGLDGPLFEELARSANLGAAEMFAGMSRAQIREYERAYARRAGAASSAGSFASGEVFGKAIADQATQARELRAEVRELRRSVNALTDPRSGISVSNEAARKIGKSVSDGVNGAVGAGNARGRGGAG